MYRILFFMFFALAYAGDFDNVKSLEADFKQEIKGDRGAIPVVYGGKLYAANNRVKWQYTKPLDKEVYLQNNTAYIYEPALKQVTIGRLKENVDFIHILKKVKKNKDGLYETIIGDIKYSLHTRDSIPYMLVYKDSLENDIVIVFENVAINKEIDFSVFNFQPPEDVEYIETH